ncbi:conserved hypothetical protein [Ricinus communis]|uniref:DUF7722 domain-containing protein n=1 Tax=Ricinus communis TaxID=3988 RepID=B9SE01_RICCO|nr:conserved hypothetical protein [Ricinus communis]
MNKEGGACYFQMPVHYPRYTKKDYENMPEWQLDRLLADYGLPINGDLGYKREFAMGSFLWPDSSATYQEPKCSSSCSSAYGFDHDSSPCGSNKFKIVGFLFRLLRDA